MDETDKILEDLQRQISMLYTNNDPMSDVEFRIINVLGLLINVVRHERLKEMA